MEDGQAVRTALLEIIKYYLQKDLNIKEVCNIIAYIASVNHEHLILEIIELILTQLNNKSCKDQLYLLMHEPQTAELCYSLLTDRKYSKNLHKIVLEVNHFLEFNFEMEMTNFFHSLQFLSCLLNTKRVSKKHKSAVRLYDPTISCQTLYPGLISHMLPLDLDRDIILMLLDLALCDDSGFGYCGALHLIHHLSEADIELKIEVAKKLLTVAYSKLNSPLHIAKQCGWQESIARLLVRKHITSSYTVEGNYVLGKDIQYQPFDETGVEFAMDVLTFDEKSMELGSQSSMNRDHNLILNEIQASVTEAANVIEHEIKGNFGSYYC